MKLINYLKERIEKIGRMRRDFIGDELGSVQKFIILADLAFSIIIFGCGITDYFQYRFYGRSYQDRKTFMVHRQRMWLVRRFNDRKDREIFDNKAAFNRKFSSFLGREWLEPAESALDQFTAFAFRMQKFMVKPIRGSHGIGVEVLRVSEIADLPALFEKLKTRCLIVEELIEQHEDLAKFNAQSVNTLRVVTLLGADGKVNLITANLRIGNGPDRFADNFHHNGIAALIDIKSGLVSTAGVDKNLNYFSDHPGSGKKIKGFKVPAWDRVVDTVCRAALVVPTVRYVGWDLAVGKDGQAILIEGNAAADPDISQMPDQAGKWPLYRRVLQAG